MSTPLPALKTFNQPKEQDKRPTFIELIKTNTSLKLHLVFAILLIILYMVL